MADLRNIQATPAPASARTEAAIDEGLRAYMIRVYNLMALGLAITGVAAFATAQMAVSSGQLTGFGQLIFASPLRWMVMLAPLGFVFFLSARIQRICCKLFGNSVRRTPPARSGGARCSKAAISIAR